tara:strand:- start:1234 stop:1377 length:144 start_codon:yes stop_codon:yes gene_type:complete
MIGLARPFGPVYRCGHLDIEARADPDETDDSASRAAKSAAREAGFRP